MERAVIVTVPDHWDEDTLASAVQTGLRTEASIRWLQAHRGSKGADIPQREIAQEYRVLEVQDPSR